VLCPRRESNPDLRFRKPCPFSPFSPGFASPIKFNTCNWHRSGIRERRADIVFDVVGGVMFEQCLAALAWRGRQVAISSSPEPRVSFNLVNFYHNESRLLGVDSLKLSFEETAEILRRLTPGIEAGTFPPPAVETFPLEEGLRLYRDIAESRSKTKPILVP
jgi:NADPH:quinone reductase